MKLMIIEDDALFAEVLARALGIATVVIVPTLSEAIKRLPLEKAEAVVLDLSLPDSPPTKTLASIRELRRIAPNASLVVVTGFPDAGAKSIQSGADAFLEKQMGDTFVRNLRDTLDKLAASPRPTANSEIVDQIEQRVGEMISPKSFK